MDPIEKAIRNAFAKGNAEDRAFREKVYRSAFAALDRALQANPAVTVENAIKRRKAMQARIAEIESEFVPAAAAAPPVDAPPVDVPSKSSAPALGPASRREPVMGAERTEPPLSASPRFDPAREPILAGSPQAEGAAAGVEVSPDRDERRAARRRLPYGALIFGLLLLALVGGGVWWAAKSGMLKLPEQAGTASAPGDGTAAPGGLAEPARPGEADQDRDWITVFTPRDPALVSAPSDASAEVMQDDTGTFLRIRSGGSGSAISFDVGQGILEKLAGKRAVFDVVARSEDGRQAQMALDCNFGEFGDCGRRRYAVGQERNEYLFDVQFPEGRPGSAGTIAIDSDIDRQGRSVDIYEIRVSIAQ